jgi:hypothetical protein
VVGRIFFLDAVGPQGRTWMWASEIALKPPEHRQTTRPRSSCHGLATVPQCATGRDSVRGMGMARIVNDFLLFSCLVAFVWGLALAAANLLT